LIIKEVIALTFPTFIFGSLFALLIGSIFHLILGGDFKRLLLYLITSWMGFWIGDFAGKQVGLQFLKIGLLNFGFAGMGSLVLLAIVYWLGMDNSEIVNNKKQ
jgi:hypothetical protein